MTENAESPQAPSPMPGMQAMVVYWLLFFAVCAGLGYPILNRYDPTVLDGTSDSHWYVALVTQSPQSMPDEHWRYRVVLPYLARPIYHLAADDQGKVGPWAGDRFALLFVASIFTATTALLIVLITIRLPQLAPTSEGPSDLDRSHGSQVQLMTGLIAAFLFLLNFWVPNAYLAGLVDTTEACAAALMAWAILTQRWWMLLLFLPLGAACKETFATLGAAFAGGFWLFLKWRGQAGWKALGWIVIAFALSWAAIFSIRLWISGHWLLKWGAVRPHSTDYLHSLKRCFLVPGFWYPWVWLVPLAWFSIRRVPGAWLSASLAATGVAMAGGIFMGTTGDNISRPMFSMLGPALSIAAAMTLVRLGSVSESDPADLPGS